MTETQKIWLLYSGAILLGAFLMFLIQPLIGKIITPMYGGSSQVWAVCLLFFQLTLLGGYGLTWCLSKLKPKLQAFAYILLMGLSILMVRIPLGESWQPPPDSEPVFSLLKNLMTYLAIPAILLSTVSTTIQNWFRLVARQSPFQLYSISNIGSMGALLAYPTLIEPRWTIAKSLQLWTWGYWGLVAFACLSAVLLLVSFQKRGVAETESLQTEPVPGDEDRRLPLPEDFMKWIGYAALGTSLLISFTGFITHNIAPVPLLWIIPLIVYLMTFILCFGSDTFYRRNLFIIMAQLILLACMLLPIADMLQNILMTQLLLFLLCTICHGEIYISRPKAQALPIFYLSIAFGGALGGTIMNLVLPVVFDRLIEYSLLLLLTGLLTLFIFSKKRLRLFHDIRADKSYVLVMLLVLGLYAYNQIIQYKDPSLRLQKRNFYGSASVRLGPDSLSLINGTILHGMQFFDPEKKQYLYFPTSYYTAMSGAGISDKLLRQHRKNKPMKIGVIGLGVGTLATYAQAGDEITFYELDPKIETIAQQWFRFLADCRGKVNVILGDGRLSLKAQKPQQYDILVIDAFSSDAIPIHLITREAVQLYRQHLKPDGLIVFHLSNLFLDLPEVTGNLALDQKMHGIHIYSQSHDRTHQPSIYTVMTSGDWFEPALSNLDYKGEFSTVRYLDAQWQPKVGAWTDSYSNLWSIFLKDSMGTTWYKPDPSKPPNPSEENRKL